MSALQSLLTGLACLLLPAADTTPEDVDFGLLSGFDYIEGEELPDEITALDLRTVSVSGFMRSEDGSAGPVEYFMLINDACGCTGMPKLNEVIFCAMPSGELTDIKPGSVTVTGTIYVGEEREDGIVLSLYTMDVDTLSQ